ncbi:hypothetical protein F5Y17DRAFT_111899 [Xylariaceae sp. FL0594]|nr:hypothetical protein F5Y17DRAFT_111899 [Xylariaceae sp. FL0594]
MGQSQSQPQEEEGYDSTDSIDDTIKQEPGNNNPASDEIVFSSQAHGFNNPTLRAPVPRAHKELPSSPALHPDSSVTSTSAADHKMAEVSPFPSTSYLQSSMDVDGQPSQGDLPQPIKKKRKSKKRLSSGSQPDNNHLPLDPTSSFGLATPVFDGEHQPDQAETNGHSQLKKERKETKRSARIAKVQAEEASQTSQPIMNAEQSTPYSDIWHSQESVIAAKIEPENEDLAGTHPDEQVESTEAAQKKRKRKSRNQGDEVALANSKKHKHVHGMATGGEQAANSTPENASASHDNTIDLNALAEEIYTGRNKRKAQAHAVHNDPTAAVPASGADAALGMEIAVVTENGREASSDIPIDPSLSNGRPFESMAHAITYQSNPFASSQDLAHEFNNNGPISTITTGDAEGHDEEAIAGHTSTAPYQEVEVPSSMPIPSNAGESSVRRRAGKTYSTGRKRVVKPDFFSRVAEGGDNMSEAQSPTAAALLRRKGKGTEIPASETGPLADATPAMMVPDNAGAGNTVSADATPARMAQDNAGADNAVPATPSSANAAPGRGRGRGGRTPKTPPTLTGAFTEFELRNISQAIERWREDNNMTKYDVNELIHRNPKENSTAELWEHIVATCPGRSRQKVINMTRRKFHNFVARGTWTPEQQAELKEMYDLYGNRYSLIGGLINRHPEDIRDRIRNYLVCGDNLRKDAWTAQETEQLVAIVQQAVAEIQKQRAARGLDTSRPVEDDINWQLVSEGMGRTRSRLQCISKWKTIKPQLEGEGMDGELLAIDEIIAQARETALTMSYRNRSLVIKTILKSGANADSRIPWLKIRNELNQQWTRPPLMVVWFRLKRSIPNFQSLNVKEVCSLLLQGFQQTHKLEYPSDDSPDLDYEAEYKEIAYKIKKARRAHATAKKAPTTPATVDPNSDDEQGGDEGAAGEEKEDGIDEAFPSQLGATGETQMTVEGEESQEARPSSIDLATGIAANNNQTEIQDSEPEANTRPKHHRRRRRQQYSPSLPIDPRLEEFDAQSSDTNASQASSIPAR